MKAIKIIISGILMLFLISAQNPNEIKTDVKGIDFKSVTYSELIKLAKEQDKPIFIELSTSWCAYCKKMRSKVYTNEEVGEFYNSNFINVTFDGEKSEGKKLVKKFDVKGYPTFIFLNSAGIVTKKAAGYYNSKKFLELGKSI